ncbi:MAG: hypothetical protein JWQ08_1884, partial [Deinococcus sp.]|nr:hypothetical protein [Deinococcus sp.]
FIAMANASNGHAYNRQLSDWVKRELLGLTKPEREEVKLDTDTLQAFAGTYDIVGQPHKIEASVEDGKVMLVIPNTTAGGTETLSLRFVAPECAVVVGGDADGLGVEFLTGGGEVEFLRFGARLYPRERAGTASLPVDAL